MTGCLIGCTVHACIHHISHFCSTWKAILWFGTKLLARTWLSKFLMWRTFWCRWGSTFVHCFVKPKTPWFDAVYIFNQAQETLPNPAGLLSYEMIWYNFNFSSLHIWKYLIIRRRGALVLAGSLTWGKPRKGLEIYLDLMECKLLEKVKSLSLFENYLMSRDPEVKIFQNINGEQRNLLITSFYKCLTKTWAYLGAIPRKVSEGIQYTERNT